MSYELWYNHVLEIEGKCGQGKTMKGKRKPTQVFFKKTFRTLTKYITVSKLLTQRALTREGFTLFV